VHTAIEKNDDELLSIVAPACAKGTIAAVSESYIATHDFNVIDATSFFTRVARAGGNPYELLRNLSEKNKPATLCDAEWDGLYASCVNVRASLTHALVCHCTHSLLRSSLRLYPKECLPRWQLRARQRYDML
jgi:hypothetical protein